MDDNQDWVVEKWGLTTNGRLYGIGNVPYPYWVQGTNMNDNNEFFWQVPDLDNKRFDMTNAMYCDNINKRT